MRNGSVCIRRLAVVLLGTLTWRAAFSQCGLMRGSPGIIANRILGDADFRHRVDIAFNDQGASHAFAQLRRDCPVFVCVIPKSARRMIVGNIDLILHGFAGLDREQHVVAVAGRRHMQTVRM